MDHQQLPESAVTAAAGLILAVCAMIGVPLMLGALQMVGVDRILVGFGGMLLILLGTGVWVSALAPYGNFGPLGAWADRAMQTYEQQEREKRQPPSDDD